MTFATQWQSLCPIALGGQEPGSAPWTAHLLSLKRVFCSVKVWVLQTNYVKIITTTQLLHRAFFLFFCLKIMIIVNSLCDGICIMAVCLKMWVNLKILISVFILMHWETALHILNQNVKKNVSFFSTLKKKKENESWAVQKWQCGVQQWGHSFSEKTGMNQVAPI